GLLRRERARRESATHEVLDGGSLEVELLEGRLMGAYPRRDVRIEPLGLREVARLLRRLPARRELPARGLDVLAREGFAAAVGLAAACAASERDRITMADRCEEFQTQLVSAFSLIKGVAVTARGARRLPGHVHVTVEGVASDELLFLLDQEGVRASAAAACSSGATASSHVLQAMGIAPELARGALRFTMGAETSKSDVDELIRIFAKTVHHLRPPA
ncbi:MAG: aminotransferase class V-fold PLP-dependent enzyme, partial [Actinomycetota bacterium]